MELNVICIVASLDYVMTCCISSKPYTKPMMTNLTQNCVVFQAQYTVLLVAPPIVNQEHYTSGLVLYASNFHISSEPRVVNLVFVRGYVTFYQHKKNYS